MVQPRGRPTPGEWAAVKEDCLYLYQRMTLNEVMAQLAQRGFIATTRQYKTKLKAWNADRKTIKAPTYYAMYIQMRYRESIGLTSIFLVPSGLESDFRVVRTDQITKEMNRNRSAFDSSNGRRAELILQEEGVKVFNVDDPEVFQYLQPHQHIDVPEASTHGSWFQWQPPVPRERQLSGSHTHSISPSLLSNTQNSLVVEDTTNNSQRLVKGEEMESKFTATLTSQTPFLHRSRPIDLDDGGGAGPSECHNTSPALSEVDVIKLMDSVFFSPACDDQMQDHLQPRLQPRNDANPSLAMDDEKRLVVQCATPYLQAVSARNNPNIELDLQGRSRAKEAFRSMLKQSNQYILPYYNWMQTVLASNDQSLLLIEFLMDCCEVVDRNEKGYELTYGSLFHLALAHHYKNDHDFQLHHSKFLFSTNAIRMVWGDNSPNYLVYQHYLAWFMLDQQQNEEALRILHHYLPISERVMGIRHVVTINSLAMLARALTAMNRIADAVAIIEDVVSRLANCSEVLQAYRYRQLQRLAEIQMNSGDLVQAEKHLRAILEFRRHHFGMDSPNTSDAIEKLDEVLRSQGRREEAAHHLQEATSLFHQEVEQNWFKHYKVPAPWLSDASD